MRYLLGLTAHGNLSVHGLKGFMETILIAAAVFRELMKIARKRSLLAPPEEAQMKTDYMHEKPTGLQIDWIARKLGIQPSKLQEEICSESNWPIWPINNFEIADKNLDIAVINELRIHDLIPILAEQGQTKGNERTGYIAVLAEHGLVAPMALAICRKHNLDYLFCFVAVVEITELKALRAP
jgi:hypothetical protein